MSFREVYTYITAQQLSQYKNDYLEYAVYKAVNKALTTSLAMKGIAAGKSQIFLSHSHHDSRLVHLVVGLLHKFGAQIYIDWLDPTMPKETNSKTAKKLKEKITDCSKFIMLASKGALDSHWVPWELGYADSNKGLQNLAVLPIEKNHGDWTGNEYVGIYPYIMQVGENQYFVVEDDNNNSTPLSDWLK